MRLVIHQRSYLGETETGLGRSPIVSHADPLRFV
jgi:hypothetical protein